MTENDFIHDLSNPLSAALFWVELLQQPGIPIPPHEITEKVHRLLLEMRSTLESRRAELRARPQESPAA